MSEVSRAAPDGYTLGFVNTGNIALNPYLYSKLKYDPLRDLIPVARRDVSLFLTVNAEPHAGNESAEFLAYARRTPTRSATPAGACTMPDLAQ